MAVDQIEMEALRAALNNAARDRRANELREVLERVPPTDAVAVLLALRPTELAASSTPAPASSWLPACSRVSVPPRPRGCWSS
jgi:hypothetical protein